MSLKRTERVMYGNVKVKNYVVYGDNEAQGNVDAEYVKVYGNTQIHGDAHIEKQRGMIDIEGKFSGDFVDVKVL